MLFSNPEIAGLVREQFVAAWENVRAVPIVEIDFGNGTKIKRTVNGNIATYVCAPDGRVLDIIPGLNSPGAYLEDLRHALNLYRATFAQGADFEKVVRDYHIANRSEPARYAPVLDVSKSFVESRLRVQLVPAADSKKREVERPVRGLALEDAMLLAADTEINRKERKPLLHRMLSEKTVRPEEITRRVYKEVLHCDLDDPYLGLISKAFSGGAYEER